MICVKCFRELAGDSLVESKNPYVEIVPAGEVIPLLTTENLKIARKYKCPRCGARYSLVLAQVGTEWMAQLFFLKYEQPNEEKEISLASAIAPIIQEIRDILGCPHKGAGK